MSSLVLVLALAGDVAAAEAALRAGEPARALQLLGDLADADDAEPRALAVQGRALVALGEPRAAVEPLIRASDARPEDLALARDGAYACWLAAEGIHARLYLEDARRLARRAQDPRLLADLDFAAGDFERALEGYLSLAPEAAGGLTVAERIGECRLRLGQEPEAKEAFGKALEAALAEDDLGAAYRNAFRAGRPGLFLSWLDGRIAASPDDVELRLYRGYARTEAVMYPEAIEDLRFVVARRRQAAVKDRLAHALLQHGVRVQDDALVREAEALSRDVLDAEPANQPAWERLSWIAWRAWANADVERSYAILRDLNGRDPEDQATALNFGAMARRLGRYDEARAVYEHLLEITPAEPDVLNDYAILLDGLGDRVRAVELWEETLRENPDDLNALENLFTHHWERGDREATERMLVLGLEAARAQGGPVERWIWFRNRLLWAPSGFGE